MAFFSTFYDFIIRCGARLQPIFVLAVRLYWGLAFLEAGIGKFLNHGTVATSFQALHIPFAEVNAYLVAFFEAVGGLALVLGFGARLMSVPLIIILCVAYATAHREVLISADLFIAEGAFNYLMASLIVFCYGPGAISIDRLLMKKSS